jgi:hypothetical protein
VEHSCGIGGRAESSNGGRDRRTLALFRFRRRAVSRTTIQRSGTEALAIAPACSTAAPMLCCSFRPISVRVVERPKTVRLILACARWFCIVCLLCSSLSRCAGSRCREHVWLPRAHCREHRPVAREPRQHRCVGEEPGVKQLHAVLIFARAPGIRRPTRTIFPLSSLTHRRFIFMVRRRPVTAEFPRAWRAALAVCCPSLLRSFVGKIRPLFFKLFPSCCLPCCSSLASPCLRLVAACVLVARVLVPSSSVGELLLPLPLLVADRGTHTQRTGKERKGRGRQRQGTGRVPAWCFVWPLGCVSDVADCLLLADVALLWLLSDSQLTHHARCEFAHRAHARWLCSCNRCCCDWHCCSWLHWRGCCCAFSGHDRGRALLPVALPCRPRSTLGPPKCFGIGERRRG